MADPPDLSPQIEEAATAGIQSATVDGNTTVAMSVKDQIEADRYLAAKAATRTGRRGFRMAKLVSPSAG